MYEKFIQVYADGSDLAKRGSKTNKLVSGLNASPKYGVRLTTTLNPSGIHGADIVVNALSPELDTHRDGRPFVTFDEFQRTRPSQIGLLVDRVYSELEGEQLGEAV